MSLVVLNAYRVEEMQFRNVLETGTQITLENKYSFNVKYTDDNKCIGNFFVEVYDKNNKTDFFASTRITAFCSYKNEMEKDAIHREAFRQVFPYAKSIITTITANGGVPPIILPAVDIDSHSIYRFDIGNNK